MRFEFLGVVACPFCSYKKDFATDDANLESLHLCEKCGAPRPLHPLENEFSVLGLLPKFSVNLADVQKNYILLSKRLHPDRFSAIEPKWVTVAQSRMGLLNKAFTCLKNKELKRDAVFRALGRVVGSNDVKSQDICLNGKRSMHTGSTALKMPLELADEWFDIQDDLESGQTDKVPSFLNKLDSEIKIIENDISKFENQYDQTLPGIDGDALNQLASSEMSLNTLISLRADLINKVKTA